MARPIFHFFDVMLKLIAIFYGNFFLMFLGIEGEIEKILNVEVTTRYMKVVRLDFLCLLVDGTIRHIEFHYNDIDDDDRDRYFRYNILSEAIHDKLTETTIFRFCKQKKEKLSRAIGRSKTFHMDYFYLGNVDFEMYFRKVNMKVNSYINTGVIEKIDPLEEITLLTYCLVEDISNEKEILGEICNFTKYGELFDSERLNTFKFFLDMEMDNLISKEEKEEIENGLNINLMEDVVMSPQVMEQINKAIYEVTSEETQVRIDKSRKEGIKEGIEKGVKEGIKKGVKEGIEKGVENTTKNTIKKLKKFHTSEEIAEMLELDIDYVNKVK